MEERMTDCLDNQLEVDNNPLPAPAPAPEVKPKPVIEAKPKKTPTLGIEQKSTPTNLSTKRLTLCALLFFNPKMSTKDIFERVLKQI